MTHCDSDSHEPESKRQGDANISGISKFKKFNTEKQTYQYGWDWESKLREIKKSSEFTDNFHQNSQLSTG